MNRKEENKEVMENVLKFSKMIIGQLSKKYKIKLIDTEDTDEHYLVNMQFYKEREKQNKKNIKVDKKEPKNESRKN